MRLCWILAIAASLVGLHASAVAQIAMPAPGEMSGRALPSGDLPDGAISVRLINQQLSNNITDHPVELHEPAGRVHNARTGEDGRAMFTGLPAGTTVYASAVVDGERLQSETFAVPARGGIRLMLVAGTAGTPGAGSGQTAQAPFAAAGAVIAGGQSRIVIEISDEVVEMYYLLELVGAGGGSAEDALVFELPEEARSTTILQGSTSLANAQGQQVVVNGPLPAGRTPLHIAYRIPYDGPAVTVTQPLPVAMEQLAVVVEHVDGLRLESPQLPNYREMTAEGQRFLVAGGPGLPAGSSFTLTLSGLPHHSPVPRTVALALAALILGAGAWIAIGGRGREARPPFRTLSERREQLFADLVNLEERRAAGRLDAHVYASRREELIEWLEHVYAELAQSASTAEPRAVARPVPIPNAPSAHTIEKVRVGDPA